MSASPPRSSNPPVQYTDTANPPSDPYGEAYAEPTPAATAATPAERDPPPARGRSRSRSPVRANGGDSSYNRSPGPRRPSHAPIAPNPSAVLGVFGLSIRTTERDLEDEFNRYGQVEKVTIVYDQRSDRSRGFGFISMSAVEEATRCIKELNGVELNGRRIRVDYSVTDRPHAPTPGEYMGHRRRRGRDTYSSGRDYRDDRYDDYRDQIAITMDGTVATGEIVVAPRLLAAAAVGTPLTIAGVEATLVAHLVAAALLVLAATTTLLRTQAALVVVRSHAGLDWFLNLSRS
ncbi:hypothetical protein EIP91_008384 [Steccherinum ochraceum]|uniref:RRM domain-containing protein n=1 Tax=Steccherinum ochraceum TaxID=92696 RepID=A0A4R0R5N9_9APHY|nr:hypothetical protein EIP91_008384 [Steccherinum ochraceum]